MFSNTFSVYLNVRGMNWNIIASNAEAHSCTFRFKRQLRFPTVTCAKQECVGHMSSSVYSGEKCTGLMTAWSPDLRGTPVGR